MVAIPAQGFRRVMHCDLDCFYAAVEELDNPALRGRPVIVGGDPNRRGVVSTANYIARRYGAHSAMSAALARRLCPHAVFLRPRFDRYGELSRKVMAILDDFLVVREQVSIDEAYGELPPGLPGCRPAQSVARELKARVLAETGLVISIGVGPSKSIAKLASDTSKPDGLLVVRPGSELAFLHPLPVGQLHGVGPHTRERLERLGVSTVGQLAAMNPRDLHCHFGKLGRWLWDLANGHDERPVVGEHGPPKSVSREHTYERDVSDLARAQADARDLAASVARRAASQQLEGRTVTLKIKWSDFRLMTRQRPLARATNDAGELEEAAEALILEALAPALAGGGAFRLLGLGLSGFGRESPHGVVQLSLFEQREEVEETM